MEQLAVFVRFFDVKTFREELLCLLPLPGWTSGEIVFNELTQFLEGNGLDLSKIASVVKDGAPSIVGHHEGLVSRLSAVNPPHFTASFTKQRCALNWVEKCKRWWIQWQDLLTLFVRALVCNIVFSEHCWRICQLNTRIFCCTMMFAGWAKAVCWRGCVTCMISLYHFCPICRANQPKNLWAL